MVVKYFLSLFIALPVFAAEKASLGADVLIKSVGPIQKGQNTGATMDTLSTVKLTRPISIRFFSQWQNAGKMDFHQNRWARLVLDEKWEQVAHLWSVVQKTVDERFSTTARAAYVFSLWELGLGQTFWNEWFEMLQVKRIRDSKDFVSLNMSIQEEFGKQFFDWAIHIEKNQADFLFSKIQEIGPIYDTIRAYVLLRNVTSHVEYAKNLLLRLPDKHPYYIPLVKTLALHFAKQGKLGEAGSVLKKIENRVLAGDDLEAVTSYYLQIARLLYQSGNLSAAKLFYQKVPKGSHNFLTAREELAWVLLQSGEFASLRGELQTFRMNILKDEFLPEIHLVSAIGNLKLCFYGEVQEDFNLFLKKNRRWARQIEKELKTLNPTNPDKKDFYIQRAQRSIEQRLKEQKTVQVLTAESKTAALPAVGIQPHWPEAEKALAYSIEQGQKRKVEEYRRVWRSRRFILQEAIKKMQFVKIELMGQMSRLRGSKGVAKRLKGNIATKLVASNSTMTFPFDGLVWPDEMFQLQSVTKGECL